MNRHDWGMVACIAAVVLERFAEAVESGSVGDGNGFNFIRASRVELHKFDADMVGYAVSIMDRYPYMNEYGMLSEKGGGYCYRPEQVLQCVIEQLIERWALALADDPSEIYSTPLGARAAVTEEDVEAWGRPSPFLPGGEVLSRWEGEE